MEGILKGLVELGVQAVRDYAAGEQERHSGGDERERQQHWSPSGSKSDWSRDPAGPGWRRENLKSEEEDGEWQESRRKRIPRKHYQAPEEHRQAFRKNASEQEYSEAVDSSVDLDPTKEELNDYKEACSRLWSLDINRLVPGQDYEIDCGEGKKIYNREDMAENALFKFVNRDVFSKPTYARFYALLDNYHAEQDVSENLSARQEQEQLAFIEEISRTAAIQYLFRYLVERRIITGSMDQFKQQLHQLWFDLYKRENTRDSSSAFEHVFVGEIKDSIQNNEEVSGLHNWIQFYIEEAKRRLDYQGYIMPRRHGVNEPDSHSQLITVQFTWNGAKKPESSTFIGVSPEFELALFTLCFFCGEEDNHLYLGSYPVNIKCYRFGRTRIGSVFPIAQ